MGILFFSWEKAVPVKTQSLNALADRELNLIPVIPYTTRKSEAGG